MKKKKAQAGGGPKKAGPKPSNPFEIKVHKVKHQVLGKKSNKEAVGNPNKKKQKGLDARKASLLREYKNKNKSNLLRDKRLGENDASISLEDKMLKRFAKERLKSDKKSKFNLNDDDDDEEEEDNQLTHMGQSVAEIQDMKAPALDSDFEDDEEDGFGRLGAEHVEKLHFGGGEDKTDEQSGKRKHADIIEEIIAKSKQAKFQRRVEKDESEEMTGKLDEQFKSLAEGLLGGKRPLKKDEERKATEKGKPDDYDVLVRELMFEKKGVATDRLKTEEEIAKAEMEQLEALEQERIIRMRGIDDDSNPTIIGNSHRSADDLDDGFILDENDKRNKKKVGFTLAYKDGKAIKEGGGEEEEEEEEIEGGVIGDSVGKDEGEEEDGEEEDGSDEDSEDDDEEDEEEGYSDMEDDEKESDEDDEEEDDEEDDDEDDAEETPSKTSSASKKGILKRSGSSEAVAAAVAAKREIPYTFTMPTTLSELEDLLRPYNEKEQLIVIDRIRKCHHPSLAEGNKEKLVQFFGLLLELFLESSTSPSIVLLDGLTHHIYDMLRLDHGGTGRQVHHQLVTLRENHDWRSAAPLKTCLFLQLVSRLYPTSDFTHPVVTPAFLFLGEILQRTSINSVAVVTSGLFLSALAYDYVSLAKRFMPEPLNFLNGLLFLARDDGFDSASTIDFGQVAPPCRPVGKHNRMLRLGMPEVDGTKEAAAASSTSSPTEEKHTSTSSILTIASLSSTLDASSSKKKSKPSLLLSTASKIAILERCVDLLTRFRQLYKELPALKAAFSRTRYFLAKLPSTSSSSSTSKSVIPADLAVKIQSLLDSCGGGFTDKSSASSSNSSNGAANSAASKLPRLTRLQRPKPRPQALPQFEPKFDMEFDGRKRFAGDQQRKDKLRLERQYKMEFKAAAKDLRQDAAFLANVKISEQIAKDKKRADKVKEIYGHLSTQEGEHKQMERMKKRK